MCVCVCVYPRAGLRRAVVRQASEKLKRKPCLRRIHSDGGFGFGLG